MKCPYCGFENDERVIYCGECGEKLRLTIDEEKRIATILFADLKGFTSISEKLGSEEVKELVDNVFSKMSEIIERNGGYIDKYIGDCIMALFGAPLAYGDDPERAVRSGLEMQKKLKEINSEVKYLTKGTELSMRIGINTGEVVAGAVGKKRSKDYTVLGDAVNTAKRIEEICEPGKVWISETTYKFTKEIFEFKELPVKPLKHKEQKIMLYEVTGLRKETPEFEDLVFEPEFVDREDELKFLIETFDSSKEKSKFIFLKGEHGSGKTKLLKKFTEKIKGRCEVHWIYPDPFSSSLLKGFSNFIKNYYPVRDFISKIEKDPVKIEAGEYLDFALFPEKSHFFTEFDREKKETVFYAFSVFLSILNQRKFNVYILENAHLMDRTSIELLKYLSEFIDKSPSLFIVSVRNSFYDSENLQNIKNFFTLELKSFSLQQTRNLLRQGFGIKNPENIYRKIYENSMGNPLFIKNIFHFLTQENFLKKEKDGIYFIKDINSLKLPATFKDFARANIDRLGEEKDLLPLLACLGERFDSETVFMLSEQKKLTLSQKLNKLLSFEILEKEKGKEKEFYRFKSPLYREIILESLLKKTRKKIHEFVATKLEEKEKAYFYPLIAYNYESSGNINKSVEYYKKSLQRCLNNFSYDEGIVYSEKILTLTENEETREWAKLKMAECLLKTGNIEDSEKIFKELWEKSKNQDALFSLLEILIEIKGRYGEARKFIEQIDTSLIDHENVPRLFQFMGLTYHYEENLKKAEEYYLEALKRAKGEEELIKITIFNSLGGIYYYKNELDKALVYFKKALEYSKQIKEKEKMIPILINIGSLYYKKGGLEEGLEYYEEALSICSIVKNKGLLGRVYTGKGFYYYAKGEYPEAISYFKKALEIFEIFNMKKNIAMIYNYMTIIYTKEFFYQKALENLDRYINIMQEMNIKSQLLYGLYNKSRILLFIGEFEKAEEINQQVMNMSEQDNPEIFARSLMNLGDIYALKDNFKKSLEHYEKALKIIEELKFTPLKLNAFIRMSKLLLCMNDKEQSLIYLKKAKEIQKTIKDKEMEGEINLLESELKDDKKAKKDLLINTMYIAQKSKNYRLLLKALYLLSIIDRTFENKFSILLKQLTKDSGDIDLSEFVKILYLLI